LRYPSPWIALKCTKTSGPSSWVMKPNPFSGLNHFTVPVVMPFPPFLAVPDLSAVRSAPASNGREGNSSNSNRLVKTCGTRAVPSRLTVLDCRARPEPEREPNGDLSAGVGHPDRVAISSRVSRGKGEAHGRGSFEGIARRRSRRGARRGAGSRAG